ncbi:hypothetical protein BN946_scf184746.g9 [Trametes cinnabarina]|uniref:Nuclear pore complex protein Nup85 n=1 Tax=Pycnoporus cinnabarinus TaxID=5643 RepID=A0A060SAD8_PYCCI|nr:hypothetical protein BN946_scf184746.g9 [Trametes cinnabarina]
MRSSGHLAHLVPPLFETGGAEDFQRSGRTLSHTVSPRDDSIAIYASIGREPQSLRTQGGSHPDDQQIYFANKEQAPRSERRVQNITRAEPLQFDAEHYRCLWTCFSLFAVLYLPEPGFEDAPVGDELMEWLNTHFVEPSTQEGDDLSSQERPWEDPAFWPYLTRTSLRGLSKASTFFLNVLSKHPSTYLQSLAQQLSPLLTNHPRLYQFSAERDFAVASRRWKDKVKTLRLELDRVPESERDDGFENWWDRFSDIVGVLEGRGEVVKRICTELGADWKEVCSVWGIFVDTRLRRQDLPEVVAQVLDEMPPDPTDREDMVHSALLLGRPTQALSEAAQLDIWLAAHLADLMDPIELIDSEADDSELSLRQHYILSYAGYLRTDPALWRITVDYMYSCGAVGSGMADQVLMRVPLRLEKNTGAGTSGEEAARIRAGHLAGVLKDVNETCFEYQREEIRRMVCRIAAQTFVKEKEYGLAISYCTSAEDWAGLGRVVDLVLEEYIAQGPEQFARLVANIAPSLHALRTDAGTKILAPGVFLHRLMFAVRFAEFHQRRASGDIQGASQNAISMFREEVAPKSWWAVLLCDALDLLRDGASLAPNFVTTD